MRPYPWKCVECKQRAVVPAVTAYTAQIKHENLMHTVEVPDLPVHRCEQCCAIVVDDDADERIRAKLRDDLGLLQPEVIRAKRTARGLTQDELGDILGIAGESISRWECGVVQAKATDNLLRSFFEIPAACRYMTERARVGAQVTVTLEEVTEPWCNLALTTPTWDCSTESGGGYESIAGNSIFSKAA